MENKINDLNNDEKKDYIKIKRSTLRIIIACIVIVSFLFLLIFTLIKVNQIDKNVINVNEKLDNYLSINNNYQTEMLDIETKDYYSKYAATKSNFDNLIKDVDTYILYFHQTDCQACLEANVFIDSFIQKGYLNVSPIIFVTPQQANSVFTKYNIESTPTAIYVNKGETSTYIGVDEIFNMLDDIVNKASN